MLMECNMLLTIFKPFMVFFVSLSLKSDSVLFNSGKAIEHNPTHQLKQLQGEFLPLPYIFNKKLIILEYCHLACVI